MTNPEDFKTGDRVKMLLEDGRYATGEIILRRLEFKVLFDGDFDLNYDYYPASWLTKETE